VAKVVQWSSVAMPHHFDVFADPGGQKDAFHASSQTSFPWIREKFKNFTF
jgi:hypothetical protein